VPVGDAHQAVIPDLCRRHSLSLGSFLYMFIRVRDFFHAALYESMVFTVETRLFINSSVCNMADRYVIITGNC